METLCPRLPPSEEGSEIEKKTWQKCSRRGKPPNTRVTITVSNTKSGANGAGKRALEAKFGANYRMLDRSTHWINNPLLRDCKGKIKGGIG